MVENLQDIRASIDLIDDQLLDLICRRMELSAAVASAKSGGVTYRPGREAEVFLRLAEQAPDLPAGIARNIWRQIMTASSAQQDRSIGVAVLDRALPTASWHFGGQLSLIQCNAISACSAAMQEGVAYSLVPVSEDAALAGWLMQDRDLHIIAVTPFEVMSDDGDGLPPCYVIGRTEADSVRHETTLIACGDADLAHIEACPGRPVDVLAGYAMPARIAGVIATSPKTD